MNPSSPFLARRRFLSLAAAVVAGGTSLLLLVNALPGAHAASDGTLAGPVRIGFQKAGTVLLSLKAKGTLEKQLQPKGATLQWAEFPAGLPMVEALNAGAIDIAYVGEAPPVIAQAANGSITRYVAYDPWGPDSEGIVVQKDSGIRKLADLRGKRIAVQKGSNSHYLLVKALASAKLKPADAEIVFLKPADARAAFERKDLDAWSIWDPFLAAAEALPNARLLTSAKGLAPNRGYYLASAPFIKNRPDALKAVLASIKKEALAVEANPAATAAFLAPSLGLDVKVLKLAEERRRHDALPLTDKIIERQQDVADTFSELRLIPRSIKVRDAVWIWK
ncbi:MAG: sulfonate ABC transporter substrate-binding protein [Cyanobium sp. CACIAM 14]|nr:MAG: sulfonate ABC transporter substrate-binding protein [Cyanobium sp. CACIAM 14]